MTNRYTFCERLKELREESGLSLKEMSKKLNGKVSAAAIGRWEQGTRIPKMDGLIALADFFGVSIDYLVGRED